MEALALVKSMEVKGAIPASGSGASPPGAREPSAAEAESPAMESKKPVDEIEKETREKIEKIAQAMDEYVRSSQRSLKIRVDSRTGRTIVRVISKEDGRTIREIPPEQALNLASRMEEMMGFLFDEKV